MLFNYDMKTFQHCRYIVLNDLGKSWFVCTLLTKKYEAEGVFCVSYPLAFGDSNLDLRLDYV